MERVVEKLEALGAAGLWRSVEIMAALALGEEGGRGQGELRLLQARAASELGETRRAVEMLEELADCGVGGDKVSRELMRLHSQLGQHQEAAAWGEKVASRTVADNWALGRAHEASGGRKQASRCFMAVLRDNELATEALDALCRVGASPADVQLFLTKRRGGVPGWASDRVALLGKTWALAAAGSHREAAAELAALAAAALPAGKEAALLMQAEQRLLAGDELPAELPAPVDLRSSAKSLFDSRGTPRGFLAAAKAVGGRGDYGRALQYAMRAARDAPASDAAMLERCELAAGHALAGLGRLDEALACYRKAGRQGLEAAVKTLGRLGRPQDALRLAKAEYRARPHAEAALSALADALMMHANGRGKAREVLLRCLKQGGPRAKHVLRLASLEEGPAQMALLTRAVLGTGAALSDGAVAQLVPPQCLAQSWQARLAFATLCSAADDAVGALTQLRAAAALGGDATQIMAETARAQRALAGEEDHADADDDEGGQATRLSAPAPPDAPPNPFLA